MVTWVWSDCKEGRRKGEDRGSEGIEGKGRTRTEWWNEGIVRRGKEEGWVE